MSISSAFHLASAVSSTIASGGVPALASMAIGELSHMGEQAADYAWDHRAEIASAAVHMAQNVPATAAVAGVHMGAPK